MLIPPPVALGPCATLHPSVHRGSPPRNPNRNYGLQRGACLRRVYPLFLFTGPLPLAAAADVAVADVVASPAKRGQRANTLVDSPPRGVNSPRTMHHSGRTASTMSCNILFT